MCHPLGDLGVTYTVHLWLVGKRVLWVLASSSWNRTSISTKFCTVLKTINYLRGWCMKQKLWWFWLRFVGLIKAATHGPTLSAVKNYGPSCRPVISAVAFESPSCRPMCRDRNHADELRVDCRIASVDRTIYFVVYYVYTKNYKTPNKQLLYCVSSRLSVNLVKILFHLSIVCCNERLSFVRETARHSKQLKSCLLLHKCVKKISFLKACSREWIGRSLKVSGNGVVDICHITLSISSL